MLKIGTFPNKNGIVPSCKSEQVVVEAFAKVFIDDVIFIYYGKTIIRSKMSRR
jgi:hypothetical protein